MVSNWSLFLPWLDRRRQIRFYSIHLYKQQGSLTGCSWWGGRFPPGWSGWVGLRRLCCCLLRIVTAVLSVSWPDLKEAVVRCLSDVRLAGWGWAVIFSCSAVGSDGGSGFCDGLTTTWPGWFLVTSAARIRYGGGQESVKRSRQWRQQPHSNSKVREEETQKLVLDPQQLLHNTICDVKFHPL